MSTAEAPSYNPALLNRALLRPLAEDTLGRIRWALIAGAMLVSAGVGVHRGVYGVSDFRGGSNDAAQIVWTHYFLWLFPALIALAHERRLLYGSMLILWEGLALVPARAIGIHMIWAMGLYYRVAWGLWRLPAVPSSPSPAPAKMV